MDKKAMHNVIHFTEIFETLNSQRFYKKGTIYTDIHTDY